MTERQRIGEAGEQLACQWLERQGYRILHRNWRHSYHEIDIIAQRTLPGKPSFLHFVEVKARRYTPFGNPEDSVTKKKFKNLQKAADEYLFRNTGHQWIQYDVLSITLHKNGEIDYFLVEDVFL